MPCVPIPKPPMPSLPAGLTLAAPLPPPPNLSGVLAPCCTLPTFKAPAIPTPPGPLVMNIAFVSVLRDALAAVEAFFDQIPNTCPRS